MQERSIGDAEAELSSRFLAPTDDQAREQDRQLSASRPELGAARLSQVTTRALPHLSSCARRLRVRERKELRAALASRTQVLKESRAEFRRPGQPRCSMTLSPPGPG